MFRTNQPVTDKNFLDREEELHRLLTLVSNLETGSPSWLAIIGPRKIGKTSLILECARRSKNLRARIISLDVLEEAPVSVEFFRHYALRILDTIFADDIGESPEALAREPNTFRSLLSAAHKFGHLDASTRRFIFDLPDAKVESLFIRECLDLPEKLSRKLNIPLIIAIDEFQEIASLASKKGGIEPFSVMRSIWQRHRNTAYVISGSARTMLAKLVTSRSSPFFQHFSLMNLGPLPVEAAIQLLTQESPTNKKIPKNLASEIVKTVGTHPFYLQIVGEAIVNTEPPYDRSTIKSVLQNLLFTKTGRISLYFENEFNQLVGHSANLAAVLEALADGPMLLADLARKIKAPPGQTSGYVRRLGDTILHRKDGLYMVDDETFALWLRWRKPGGTIVPMVLLGEEGEKAVAYYLSRCGFELVYQSKGSRGSFDLLATRGSIQLGVQVKHSALPLRFSREEWSRMTADAKRFGWKWLIAAVSDSDSNKVVLLDPKAAEKGKNILLSASASIENVLSWVDKGG